MRGRDQLVSAANTSTQCSRAEGRHGVDASAALERARTARAESFFLVSRDHGMKGWLSVDHPGNPSPSPTSAAGNPTLVDQRRRQPHARRPAPQARGDVAACWFARTAPRLCRSASLCVVRRPRGYGHCCPATSPPGYAGRRRACGFDVRRTRSCVVRRPRFRRTTPPCRTAHAPITVVDERVECVVRRRLSTVVDQRGRTPGGRRLAGSYHLSS